MRLNKLKKYIIKIWIFFYQAKSKINLQDYPFAKKESLEMSEKPPAPSLPLVSVIIPCFNHGKYLNEAFNSINSQRYDAIEIIVVDDGSVDNTREVAEKTKGVKYIYQHNQGLSVARNNGIIHSSGELLVFLDADDWLLPEAIIKNVQYLLKDPRLAFVSGAHNKVFEEEGYIKEETRIINSDHYINLLQGNYIGMHATVMYRRWVFDEFLFDPNLPSCEDYDMYLKVTRKYPVHHHTYKIAAYRLHSSNMSGNIPKMLSWVLKVLNRQKETLISNKEKIALAKGIKMWEQYYCDEIYAKILISKLPINEAILITLIRYRPKIFFKYICKTFLK